MPRKKHTISLVAAVTGVAAFAAIASGGKAGAMGDTYYQTHENTHEQQYQTHNETTHEQYHTVVVPTHHKKPVVKHVKKHAKPRAAYKKAVSHKKQTRRTYHKTSNQYYVLSAQLQAHADLGVRALIADHHNAADLPAWKAKVDANSVAIADTMNKKYPGIKTPFLVLWRQHIVYYHEYLLAKERGDEAAKAHWKYKLGTFTWQMSYLLKQHDPHLNKYAVQKQLKVHGDLVVEIINNIAWGNDYKVRVLSTQAVAHARHMAAVLTSHHYNRW